MMMMKRSATTPSRPRWTRRLPVVALAAVCLMTLPAAMCSDDDSMEEATEEVRDEFDDATDAIKDKTNEATDEIEDEIDDAT